MSDGGCGSKGSPHPFPRSLYLMCCKLENEILKEAKNAQKWYFWVSKWSFLVIFQGFEPLSKFHFPACSTLVITHTCYKFILCLNLLQLFLLFCMSNVLMTRSIESNFLWIRQLVDFFDLRNVFLIDRNVLSIWSDQPDLVFSLGIRTLNKTLFVQLNTNLIHMASSV